jgi:uncharacterized membrane protein
VLPLDHFESDAEVVEDGHGVIVEHWASGFGLPASGFVRFRLGLGFVRH